VVAVVPADADSAVVSAAWTKLDPEKLTSLAVHRVPEAQQCSAFIALGARALPSRSLA
jgi:hypothetical protein